MNISKITVLITLAGVSWACSGVRAAAATNAAAPETALPANAAFPDEVLCRGKGVEVRRSQLDRSFLQYKANLIARGQVFPGSQRPQMETRLLDQLITTRLLVLRATDEDRENARAAAETFVKSTREQAGSEGSFQRQLQALSFTLEQFEEQVLERAICEEVVTRELRNTIEIAEERLKEYYETHGAEFERPESARIAHILLATRNRATGEELSAEAKQEKMDLMKKLLDRARRNEDFEQLAREHSEDTRSRDRGGEVTLGRGQMLAEAPEFEAAAFALETNQVSDVITTRFGYHIIKLYEKLPARKLTLEEVSEDLKAFLVRQEVQTRLPQYLAELKKAADLEYFNGAQPWNEPSESGLPGG